MTATILCKKIETPLGTMLACATDSGICLLEFTDRVRLERQVLGLKKLLNGEIVEADHPLFETLKRELDEYFRKERQSFDLPLHLVGTEFQKKVWQALLTIPYGETRSYLQLSEFLENKLAIRAVAAANGANRMAILVPCHRVIGSNGDLTGYAGGLQRKKFLLELEGNHPNGQLNMNL
jgi:AraC family transcriptional regulator of adaptative response/methylated-DNA-[protein]-cysteine methyltransferase